MIRPDLEDARCSTRIPSKSKLASSSSFGSFCLLTRNNVTTIMCKTSLETHNYVVQNITNNNETKVSSTTKRRRRRRNENAAIEIQLPFENMNKNVHVHENIGDPIV
ncbi:hypothetical protein MTR_4g063400 [Medicago truncatula]|uniref:Uncharacterized protein n=1 Tax=Medicago truncatula TaxID=3880 RepID=G7JTS1_MEDTR|nr:hypothetical protein MTR_4g063400 [Medicago truncatula]